VLLLYVAAAVHHVALGTIGILWLQVPAIREEHESSALVRMQTDVPGFYWLGQPWLRNRASSFLLGVADDARVLAGLLE
jgi:hypothetical protein